MFQTEKHDHDATKKLLKELREQNEDLNEKIRVSNKGLNHLQDEIERSVCTIQYATSMKFLPKLNLLISSSLMKQA